MIMNTTYISLLNQNWFVKLPGHNSLDRVRIEEVTEQTVLLVTNDGLEAFGIESSSKVRYKITDVDWIEQI